MGHEVRAEMGGNVFTGQIHAIRVYPHGLVDSIKQAIEQLWLRVVAAGAEYVAALNDLAIAQGNVRSHDRILEIREPQVRKNGASRAVVEI